MSFLKAFIYLLTKEVVRLFYALRGQRPGHKSALPSRGEVLVICLTQGVGDAVLASPFFRSLKSALPGCSVVAFTSPLSAQVLRRYDFVDKVLDLTSEGLLPFGRLVRKARSLKPKMAIDLVGPGTWKGALFTFLSGAKITVGFGAGKREALFTHPLRLSEKDILGIPFHELGLKLLEHLNLPVAKGTRPLFPVTTEEEDWADSFLKGNGVSPSNLLIALHPGARDDLQRLERRWPAERYALLSDRLVSEVNANVLLLGGKSEVELSQRLLSLAKQKVICAVGNTTVGEMGALLQRCDLLICNNSAPLHIAAALGTPTISIAPKGINLRRWGPYGDPANNRVIVGESVNAIPVEEVYQAAQNLLNTTLRLKRNQGQPLAL